jgi:type II secretory pathway pseudopilin PulG
MKRKFVALICGLLGTLVTAVVIPLRVHGQAEISAEKLVNALRVLNTQEYSYRNETSRFATREEMLTFLRKKDSLSKSPIDLESPKPYELAIATSLDGMHYQITLKRTSDMNDKSTWCKTAAFSDDAGVIFLGSAIGCDASTK